MRLKSYVVILPENLYELIQESKDKLHYFLAHQARKVYLNSQFKARLDVHAFDHWSTDTKQDAWFTASSFDTIFETQLV